MPDTKTGLSAERRIFPKVCTRCAAKVKSTSSYLPTCSHCGGALIQDLSDANGKIVEFLSQVDVRGDNECWLWTGTTLTEGYGNFHWFGKPWRAHRLMWMLFISPIPKGEGWHGTCVLHNCPEGDNPRCCNPAHLYLGTHQDNMDDAKAKGRTVRVVDVGARQREKTHCPRGHAYAGENLQIKTNGSRGCRECCRTRNAKRYRAAHPIT